MYIQSNLIYPVHVTHYPGRAGIIPLFGYDRERGFSIGDIIGICAVTIGTTFELFRIPGPARRRHEQ